MGKTNKPEHLKKGTLLCPCCNGSLHFEIIGAMRVKHAATKQSGNKEFYRARCPSAGKNYTVIA